jgi:hypothetical protein
VAQGQFSVGGFFTKPNANTVNIVPGGAVSLGASGSIDGQSIGAPSANNQTSTNNFTIGIAAQEVGVGGWVSNASNASQLGGNFFVRSLTLGAVTFQLAEGQGTWVFGYSLGGGLAYSQYTTTSPYPLYGQLPPRYGLNSPVWH